jgi:hypothetical protein
VRLTALLVVGSAPCALEDLAKARELYPDHEVMLVNGACTLVENAQHILAGHTRQAEEFALARFGAFPDAPAVKVHANWASPTRVPKNEYPSVTDWWPADVSSGATSAGKAALIGIRMGFKPVVLCGCPMDGSGYHPKEGRVMRDASCQRVGDPKMQERRTIRRYRERMANLAKTEFRDRVFSMSGYTREQLGAPPQEWLAC